MNKLVWYVLEKIAVCCNHKRQIRQRRRGIKQLYTLFKRDGIVYLASEQLNALAKKNIEKSCVGKAHARFDKGEVRFSFSNPTKNNLIEINQRIEIKNMDSISKDVN